MYLGTYRIVIPQGNNHFYMLVPIWKSAFAYDMMFEKNRLPNKIQIGPLISLFLLPRSHLKKVIAMFLLTHKTLQNFYDKDKASALMQNKIWRFCIIII